MVDNYSKHKDREPLDTVEAIRATLDRMGLETTLKWTSHQFDDTWSNRVSIKGTSLGTNGKGTSKPYAAASGYAELMERIQNKAIGNRTHIPETFAARGFYDYPDERMVPAHELVERHDPLIDSWLEGWGCSSDESKLALVREFAQSYYRRDDDLIAEVPFADVDAGCVRWLPPALVRRLYSSNGMAAGNTLEECLVQGLSEVFERYVRIKVLQGEVVLPQVPREDLLAWSVGELIERIEEGNRYRVYVYDGSLGKGYPVILTAIADLARGTFGVNCGAHPSMAVAVERTLTEAFQGRTVDVFSGINKLATLEESASGRNRHDVLKNGVGVYASSLFVGEPGWKYRRWESDEGQSNAELLRRMVGLLRRDGFSLLVRDSSHLGFPACHIIVGGMSETNEITPEALQRIRARRRLTNALDHFPALDQEQQDAFIAAKELDEVLSHLQFERPLVSFRMKPACLIGYIHLDRGEYAQASECFRVLAKRVGMPGALYWDGMADYAQWRSWGNGREEALKMLGMLYAPAFSRRVQIDTEEGDGLLERHYPRMNCYDCDHCEMGERGYCLGAADRDAFAKIDAALAQSSVSQEELLARLRDVLG